MQILIAVSINTRTRAHAEPGAEPITETAPESPESETAARAGQRKGEPITETAKRRQTFLFWYVKVAGVGR